MTYTKRHYLATGHLDQADDRAQEWLGEVIEEVHDSSKTSEGVGGEGENKTQIILHSNADASVVGVTVGSSRTSCGSPGSMTLQRCQGYASPMPNAVRLFAIECGHGANETYIGSDLYHFAPKGPLGDEKVLHHRPYICDGHGIRGRRPRWKLLGFFPQGSCDSVQAAAFDSKFCESGPAD
jgi:hypothetical protein